MPDAWGRPDLDLIFLHMGFDHRVTCAVWGQTYLIFNVGSRSASVVCRRLAGEEVAAQRLTCGKTMRRWQKCFSG